MENTPQENWKGCLAFIKNNTDEQTFKTWFAPIGFYSFDGGVLRLGVPNEYFAKYVDAHYMPLLSCAINKFFGTVRLSYRVKKEVLPEQRVEEKVDNLDSNLSSEYTFENFVEGNSNKLTLSVGKTIAEKYVNTFNPFFIYGNSGVGKSHLVNAIGRRIKEIHPDKRVIYVSAHLFEIQFREATKNNKFIDFMNFYQSMDVLIVDDIQEIAGKEKTENAFFNIFNHLQHNQKQLILTCDRPPVSLEGMTDRLLTRFKWGMVAELEDPDLQLRKDILAYKVKTDELPISEEVIDYIAKNVPGSIRNLEGTINSLMARSIVFENADITIDLAKNVISKIVRTCKKVVTIEHIIDAVCGFYHVKTQDIITPSRKQNIVQARQITMFLTQKHTSMSSSQIGNRVRRDHSTVLHSCNMVENRLGVDKTFRAEIEQIERELFSQKR